MLRNKGKGTLYRIVVRSELGDRYASAFEGMRMETQDGQTNLIGEVVDQPPIRHPRPHKRPGAGAAERAGLLRRRSPKHRGDRELKPLTGTLTPSPTRLIHRSAWNMSSANFAFWGFCGLRLFGILRSSSSLRPCADLTGDQNRPLDRRDVISGISVSDGRRPRTL
jgi:hypothetical protein